MMILLDSFMSNCYYYLVQISQTLHIFAVDNCFLCSSFVHCLIYYKSCQVYQTNVLLRSCRSVQSLGGFSASHSGLIVFLFLMRCLTAHSHHFPAEFLEAMTCILMRSRYRFTPVPRNARSAHVGARVVTVLSRARQ